MAASACCTAYRWPEDDGFAWLLVFPSGQFVTGWADEASVANAAVGALSRASKCPTTTIYLRHPNDVGEVIHA